MESVSLDQRKNGSVEGFLDVNGKIEIEADQSREIN